MKFIIVILTTILTTAAPVIADSHNERVKKIKEGLLFKHNELMEKITWTHNSLLEQHNIQCEMSYNAAVILNRVATNSAWRRIDSRDTFKQKNAVKELKDDLDFAEQYYNLAAKLLSELEKEAKYRALAATNPSAAQFVKMQHRIDSLEEELSNKATYNYWTGVQMTEIPEPDESDNLRRKLNNANRRARQAEYRANEAEDALFFNGVHQY